MQTFQDNKISYDGNLSPLVPLKGNVETVNKDCKTVDGVGKNPQRGTLDSEENSTKVVVFIDLNYHFV